MNQPFLLENERSRSDLNNSSVKSHVTYSIIGKMVEYRLKDQEQSGDYFLPAINESLGMGPNFHERGPDKSSKSNCDGLIFYDQTPQPRMSHIYPSYRSASETSLLDPQKISYLDHKYSKDQLENIYQTDLVAGLTDEQAEVRLRRDGKNQIVIHQFTQSSVIKEVCNSFSIILLMPIMLQLIGITLKSKERFTFIIEFVILTIIFLVSHYFTYIHYKKQKALYSEYNQLISNDSATVIRGGIKKRISSSNLVKGDLIEISADAKIPADCRIIESKQLSVDNFIFTGDTQPIQLDPEPSEKQTVLDATNIALFGAGCVHGEGKAIIINTGDRTLLGQISVQLTASIQIRSKLTLQLNKILKQNAVLILIFILVGVINWFNRSDDHNLVFLINQLTIIILSKQDFKFKSVPMTLMIIYSFSMKKIGSILQRNKIFLTDPEYVEKLASLSIVIINKESVLAKRQKVKKIIFDQQILTSKQLPQLTELAECLFYYTKNQEPDEGKDLKTDIDKTLKRFVSQFKLKFDNKLIAFKKFTAMEKFGLAIVADQILENIYYLYLVGAPEFVAEYSDLQSENQGHYQCLASSGFTLISCATKTIQFKNNHFNVSHMNYFNFPFSDFKHVGTLALTNKVSPLAEILLKKISKLSVKPILVTGDSIMTAQFLAKSLSINFQSTISGKELSSKEILEQTDQDNFIASKLLMDEFAVFARMTPSQKLMIIEAFQKMDHKVGIIGFETIDTPAMRKSDVSFAFSNSEDLVKQSANVLLLEQEQTCTSQIFKAILNGRQYCDNLIKQIRLCASIKSGQSLTVLLSIVLGLPLPLTSTGILFITLLLEPLIFTILYEKSEKPRKIRAFRTIKHLVAWIVINGSLAAVCGLVLQVSYQIVMHYLGWDYPSLISMVYKDAYDNLDNSTKLHYKYNSSDFYLGNMNLHSPLKIENQFQEYQFYKHFEQTWYDLRNSIVVQESSGWKCNFDESSSLLCQSEHEKPLCFSLLSLDLAQLGFIYGYLIWGWLHILQFRSLRTKPIYQLINSKLLLFYTVSILLGFSVALIYFFYYQTKASSYLMLTIGLPSVMLQILSIVVGEIYRLKFL